MRLQRVLRVAKVVKLLRLFRELWLIVPWIFKSVQVIIWVPLLPVGLLSLAGILAAVFIDQKTKLHAYKEEAKERYADTWNNYEFPGTGGRSMYTLLNIAILAEWPEIGRAT